MSVVAVIAFVVALLGSVMFHEWGHFTTARRFGMKATEFFVGFGPSLWSTRRGETEYGIKAIPAGGYVRIVGMTASEPIAPEDEERAFYRQPAGRRAVVLAAGSTMHMVLAVILLFAALAVFGTARATTTIASVSPCVPASGSDCAADAPPSPAAAAGMRPGDVVESVAGTPVSVWSDFTAVVRDSAGTALPVRVQRDGGDVELKVTPVAAERPNGNGGTETVGVVGLVPQVGVERTAPLAAAVDSVKGWWTLTAGTFTALVSIPSKIPALFSQAFSDAPRGPNDLVGPVGIAQGSVAILGEDLPWSARVADFLLLIAGLNVFVGWFNLLPLLPLDGGHLAILGYDQVKLRSARRKGRPDPEPLDPMRLAPVAYTFLALLIGLSLLLLTADIVNPANLGL